MNFVDPAIERYAEEHSTAPVALLTSLADDTRSTMDVPQMMVGALEGRFLEMLVYAQRPQLVLEIGTFTGYSALSMAPALPAGGRIVTCDVSERHVELARRHIEASPYADVIEIRVGPAMDTIANLTGPFDFVFIDADKENYLNYLRAVLPKLAPGGLIAADNTLWSGQVLDSADDSASTAAIRAFNEAVVSDASLVCVQLTVRDGVTLIRPAE